MSRDELIPEGIPKDKEEMENLLCGYGVSFTSSLADKLIEIMQLVRADAIDKVIKFLEAQFLMQNNPNSKFVETIVLHRDFIDALEQLKEQSNDG